MHLPALLPRWVSLAALLALHWLLALEERATLWWQTGRWAARDWLQAAVEWATPGGGSPPGWVPAWSAARGAPRRVGGPASDAVGGASGRGVRPPPPTCAALVLAEVSPGEMPVDRAAAVVNWCAQAGITRLFAYDPTGFLKQQAAGLRSHLARSAVLVLGFDGPVIAAPGRVGGERVGGGGSGPLRVRDTNAGGPAGGGAAATPGAAAAAAAATAAAAKAAAANGGPPPPPTSTSSTPAIHVHLLSASDAEETMAKAIAAVAAARRGNEEGAATATATPTSSSPAAAARAATDAAVARLDAALASASGPAALVEPGVALVYGGAFTLAGYPPWALRSAEIYSMGRLCAADGRGVAAALARYGATHQRFGA